jgi:hypothetical protein
MKDEEASAARQVALEVGRQERFTRRRGGAEDAERSRKAVRGASAVIQRRSRRITSAFPREEASLDRNPDVILRSLRSLWMTPV